MADIIEKDMYDALAYAGCAKLPRALNPAKDQSKVWIRAVAKISKKDGSESYAVLKNDYGRKPKIVKVFGSTSAIASVLSIHPYEWLKNELMPTFRTEQEKDDFLARAYDAKIERIAALRPEEKERLLYMHLMDVQQDYDDSKRMQKQ